MGFVLLEFVILNVNWALDIFAKIFFSCQKFPSVYFESLN